MDKELCKSEKDLTVDEKNAVKILNYWFAMEFLNQQSLEDIKTKERKTKDYRKRLATGRIQRKNIIENVVQLQETDSLQTIVESSVHATQLQEWGNFTIFIGSMKKETCIEKIAKNVNWDGQGPDENNDEIALAILQFSKDVEFIKLELSPLVWAMNRISGGTDNISQKLSVAEYESNVKNTEEKIKNILASIEEFPAEQNDRFSKLQDISYELLQEIKSKIYSELDLQESDISQSFLAVDFKLYMSEENIDEDENDISLHMDFFSKDIAMVSKSIQENHLTEEKKKILIDYILGLEHYGLTNEKASGRIDILKPSDDEASYKFMSELLVPEKAPLGKWPSRFMPALMQQIAVNLAINKDNELPVFSVNGPPGTGKTTLLKEIIVNNIIEKAILLSKYDKPDSAFIHHKFNHGDGPDNSYNQYVKQYHTLENKKINTYSILVTSSNNTAVENITKELPLEEKIIGDLTPLNDENTENNKALQELIRLFTVSQSTETLPMSRTIWPEHPDGRQQKFMTEVIEDVPDIYFSKFATDLLNIGNKNQNTQQAFGLISAALGKKANIQKVDDKVIRPLIKLMQKNKDIEARQEKYKSQREKFITQLKLVQNLGRKIDELIIQERNFHAFCKEAINKKENLKARKIILSQQLFKLNKVFSERQKDIDAISVKKKTIEIKAAAIHTSYEKLKSEVDSQQNNIFATRTRIETLQKSVSIFERFFKTAKYEEVQNAIKEVSKVQGQYLQQMNELNQKLQKERESFEACQSEIKRLDVKIREKLEELANLQEEIKKIKASRRWTLAKILVTNKEIHKQKIYLKKKKADYNNMDSYERGFVLDYQFIQDISSKNIDISTKAQLRNPWFSDHYNREREKLFLYALQMTKEFILSSKSCRENLKHLHCLWSGSYDDQKRVKFKNDDLPKCTAAAYETLFLLIPVISSTFSSVQRLFENAHEEDVIGTLIVDEAGQASPHMAIGALFRARKAIIVGDPKQVEPIVTDDQDLLRQTYTDDIFKLYADKTNSVQRFADIMNPYGTYLENSQGILEWVGCPLLVHRRCISPMYDISNDISYNHIMKQQTATPKPEKEAVFVASQSQWININGSEAGKKKHFVKEQGDKVIEMLEIAFSKNPSPDLFIISPFTTVVSGIKQYIIQYVDNCRNTGTESFLLKNESSLNSWLTQKIGTVHRFQGKEAAEVIFLLGCDTSQEAAPAIRWVNNNIVNVAATRAKYRLYVIGDFQAWDQSKCISRAKEIMDHF